MPDYRLEVSTHTEDPTRSRFSVVFLGPRTNAELVPKFHNALHAFHTALPILTSERQTDRQQTDTHDLLTRLLCLCGHTNMTETTDISRDENLPRGVCIYGVG
jgi:hypothetical protein